MDQSGSLSDTDDTQQMVAMSMADGYARVTGKPQCVIVHVDVGTQALGVGMHNASVGRCPVLVFMRAPASIASLADTPWPPESDTLNGPGTVFLPRVRSCGWACVSGINAAAASLAATSVTLAPAPIEVGVLFCGEELGSR